jgi:ATP-binding cassette, subfamily F, member 3
LMDEPTTHLDMGSIDALLNALEDYEGTLVFISHDVYFIRAMARSVMHISAGVLTPYAGDYQYYLDKTKATSAREALTATLTNQQPDSWIKTSSTPGPSGGGGKTKEQKRLEAEARNARSRAKKELEQRIFITEAKTAKLEARRNEIHALLRDSSTYGDGAKAVELQRELDDTDARIERLTTEWEKDTAELEALSVAVV